MTAAANKLDPAKVWLGVTPALWWNDDFPSLDIGITFGQCVSEMAWRVTRDAASDTSTRRM